MLAAPLLALAAIAGAFVLTYLYDDEAPLWPRLCAGVCLGFAALGLVGFVSASLLGMTAAALAVSGAVCALPLLLMLRARLRARLAADVNEAGRFLGRASTAHGRGEAGALVFYLVAAVVFWLVFANAMYRTPEGIFTGVDTNIGDLPFHLAVITGFARGENFPPQHPEFAGVRLTYPFVADFVTAIFVRAGAGLEGAMFWQNFAMTMSLVGLLGRWALRLTRSLGASLAATALVLLSGGFGWLTFVGEVWEGGRFFGLLGALPHDYTIMGHIGYRWGNAVTALFVTQRGILLGLSLALLVWTLWWDASVKAKGERRKAKEGSEAAESSALVKDEGRAGVSKKKVKAKAVKSHVPQQPAPRGAGFEDEGTADDTFAFCLSPFAFRPMLAAGVVAGLLPLVHAHSFVVMMLMGACLALMQGACVLLKGKESDADAGVEDDSSTPAWARVWAVWRPWLAFAAAASALAVPQMLWATRDSGARAGQFFGWEFGWDHGTSNVAWFWLKNTAVFFPLLFVAVVWWARGRASNTAHEAGREHTAARGSRKSRHAGRSRREASAGGRPLLSDRLLFFYAPFLLCFVVPNVYKLSPWVWDNIKVLIYWWVASAPLVAAVLVLLWRRGGAWRAAALALLLAQTAAGGLDVWRAASGAVERREFDRDGVAFAELIERETGPRSLILHAPTYNDPVFLTGRRSFLGYPGHVWSHGIDYAAREATLKKIYSGSWDASALIRDAGIEYVVVGPLEREEMKKYGVALNESYFNRYRKVGESGAYRLFKTRP
jgi:hypothetical protein